MDANTTESSADIQLAIYAESLFLANLLLLPGVCFVWLLYLYRRNRHSASHLALIHLNQTVIASVVGGVLLIGANLIILFLGGYEAAYTWVVIIIYFTVFHSTLVLLGILGLAKAMAGKAYIYPFLGQFVPQTNNQAAQ